MSEKSVSSFNLDDKTNQILEDFKWNLRLSKSELIRTILGYFEKNPEELKEIIKGGKEQ